MRYLLAILGAAFLFAPFTRADGLPSPLARMESWLNQRSRAELRACDRLALVPGLEVFA
jgi:hypothetical protein